MKIKRNLIIIAIALVLVVVGYFIINDIIEKNRPINPAITELITPPNTFSTDIVRYAFSISGEETVVELMEVTLKDDEGKEYTEMQFRLVNEPEKELNTNIDTALVQAAALLCADVIEENPKDIGKYGISNNSYFEVTLKNGTTYKVLFGDIIPASYNIYVMREGVDKIYTITDTSFAMLTIYREYLLSEVVFPGSLKNISSFTVYKKGVLEYSVEPDPYIAWRLVQPLNSKTYEQTVEDMIKDTYAIKIEDYVNVLPKEEDYRSYGLLNPEYSIRVEADGKKTTLHVGRQSIEDKSYYAKFDNADEVFFVSEKYLGWIDTELFEVLYPIPYEPQAKNVSGIKYVFENGDIYDLKISEKDYLLEDRPVKSFEYILNDQILDIQYGSDIYLFTFYSTIITDIDNEWEGPKENEVPYVNLELTYSSGNKENIAYYKKNDDSMYYVRYNPDLDIMEQYTGTLVDSGPITLSLNKFLSQYSDFLYVTCIDGEEHDFGEWVVVLEPTETERGRKEATCVKCGHVIGSPIPVIKHTDPGSYTPSYWWIAVVVVLLAGGGLAYYLVKRKKESKE